MDTSHTHAPRELLDAIRRDTLGSAAILTGDGSLADAALEAAAALECQSRGEAPCGRCGPCRKVFAGIHPDVVTVSDSEHKLIAIDLLRALRADAYILPNEGRRKVYLFPDCSLLDARAQNVLLKVVEDGPPHAAFLFCARSPGELLPTLRSRCTLWRLGGETAETTDPRTEELCHLLSRRDRLGLAAFFTRLETGRCTREDLQRILSQSWQAAAGGLLAACGCGQYGDLAEELGRSLSRQALTGAMDVLKAAAADLRFNLNVGHTAGAVGAALCQILR